MTSLGLSIAHWERNAAATTFGDIKMGIDHCALCQDYHDDSCEGCPVRERTGQVYCGNSPYIEAVRAHERLEELIRANDPEVQRAWEKWRAAAEAEVEFLKSLREPQE